MLGTVIIPMDGSEIAERALAFGTTIAERMDIPIQLVHICRIGADEPEMAESRNYLRKIAGNLTGRVQMRVERGRPAETIVRVAHEADDPFIVMSTHGRGGLRRWMTGSVADEVVRTAGIPVLLVRGDQKVMDPTGFPIRSILLPLDGSAYGETAIPYAVEIARAFGSTIHLLRIVDTPTAYAMLSRHMEAAITPEALDEVIGSMREEARHYIDDVATQLIEQGITVKPVVLEGYPGEQLLEHERRGFFQLVVMATAGRSGVSRIVFGSVAERMLKMGRSPVMMLRPTADDQSQDSE
jgi:nucleotide-binding universal stress UspA family protein